MKSTVRKSVTHHVDDDLISSRKPIGEQKMTVRIYILHNPSIHRNSFLCLTTMEATSTKTNRPVNSTTHQRIQYICRRKNVNSIDRLL